MKPKRILIQVLRLLGDGGIAIVAYAAAAVFIIPQPLSWWMESPFGLSILSLSVGYAASVMIVFAATRMQLRPWQGVSAHDVGRIVRLNVVATLLFLGLTFLVSRAADLPRSVLVIAWLLSISGMAMSRLLVRARAEGWLLDIVAPFRRPGVESAKPQILLVGPVAQVQRALTDIRETRAPYRPLGVVLADTGARRAVPGTRVFGSTGDLASIVDMLAHQERRKFSIVFVGEPTAMRGVDDDMLAHLHRGATPILRLPKITELTEQDRTLMQFRRVGLEELLARPQVNLSNPRFVEAVRGKRVMVTGAGGSIGSELCRQLAALGCGRLVMVDLAETALFEIDREIKGNYPSLSRRAALGDVRDAAQMSALIGEERPHKIFHAAALKHVSLMELHPREAILTNIAGTANVAKAAREHGVGQMVLLSTDKAVNPSSVMGATKRLAEALVRSLNAEGATHFSVVRFGNVLNSNGSAVPIFRRQIAAGGPVTVTHLEVERYFMTIPEAVQLVLHAAEVADARGERDPGVFVLEMGAPVKIVDMARRMIELLAPADAAPNIEIKLIGLQPGEKLSEELVDSDEETIYSTEGVLEVRGRRPHSLSFGDVETLARFCSGADRDAVRMRLFEELARVRSGASEPVRLHVVHSDPRPN